MENKVLQRLRVFIKGKNLTIKSFGDSIEVTEGTLKSMFNRGTNPSADMLTKIANEYPDISLEWLLTGKNERYTNTSIKESDESLYHLTDDYNGLINILTRKIKPQYTLEDTSFLLKDLENVKLNMEPYKNGYPIFCLCDIPIERLFNHKKKYGQYGIGFKKEWAIRNKLNPLFYLHKESSITKSISYMVSYMKKKKDDGELENDLEFESAYMGINCLFMVSKYYEKDKTRYYDEREWRWIPDLPKGFKYCLSCDNDITDSEFKKDTTLIEHQNKINESGIILDFTLDDVTHIFIPKNEIDKFIKDVSTVYDGNEIKKIADLINNGQAYNAGRDNNIVEGNNEGVVGSGNTVGNVGGSHVSIGDSTNIKKIMDEEGISIEFAQSLDSLQQTNNHLQTRIKDLEALNVSQTKTIETMQLLIDTFSIKNDRNLQ